jgi:hypothetical protein
MYTKQITFFGKAVTLACDGNCRKAWGINRRPKVEFDPNELDDVAWLADAELGDAPEDPGTYEGGCAKPSGPHEMNKWCARECERSEMFKAGEDVKARDFSQRQYNQPWKHMTSNNRGELMNTEHQVAEGVFLAERSSDVQFFMGTAWSKPLTAKQLRTAIIKQIEVLSYISEDSGEVLERFNVKYGDTK